MVRKYLIVTAAGEKMNFHYDTEEQAQKAFDVFSELLEAGLSEFLYVRSDQRAYVCLRASCVDIVHLTDELPTK